jgi:DNA-binding XRE family transcriptional regulator
VGHGVRGSPGAALNGIARNDVEVGHLIRVQRLTRGLSQTELATRIGVSFQQVHKNEGGLNRVSMRPHTNRACPWGQRDLSAGRQSPGTANYYGES